MRFYVDEIPDNIMVMDWIKSNSDWYVAVNDVKWNYGSNLIFEIEEMGLQNSIMESVNIWGYHGWRINGVSDSYYGGYSLVYNPNHIGKYDEISSTLGDWDAGPQEYLSWTEKGKSKCVKNSYYDTLGFTERTEPAKYGALGELLNEIENGFTLTRGRLAILNGQNWESGKYDKHGWHVDEPIFENLRLNIPVWGNSDDYAFQMKGYPPQKLNIGEAYTWNTNILHRAYTVKKSTDSRANLVIGICPWLEYNREERYWKFNEYYGKLHPFELLISGKITQRIKLIKSF